MQPLIESPPPMRAINIAEEKSGAAARNLRLQFPIHGKAA
jgi:hypothetical protein